MTKKLTDVDYTKHDIQLLPIAYILLILAMFILPFFSFEGYLIIKNTTSHLGAQGAPNAWIMNTLFFLLGFAAIRDGWQSLPPYWFYRAVLLVFGTSLFLCAIFRHAPIDSSISYSINEDGFHSLFANILGFSFIILAVAMSFVQERPFDRALALSIAIIATVLSVLMFQVEAYMGIWQRIIFIMSFGWMIFVFKQLKQYNHSIKREKLKQGI